MLYYRTHASRAGDMPAELVGWTASSAIPASLAENVVGEHRVVGVVPPMVFAPPEVGWQKCEAGWEVAVVDGFDPLTHARVSSTFPVLPTEVNGKTWLLPAVLTKAGERAFRVTYGGEEFLPLLTDDQRSALTIAREVRAAADAGTLPDMSIRARWAAKLLPLTHHVSARTLAVVGLHEDLIAATLAAAGGYDVPGH